MTLHTISDLGKGGTGVHGQEAGGVYAALKELQGLTVSLLAGALADTKIDLAAIRQEDTILSALNNDAGTITDVTGTMSIVSVKASGTVTLDTAVAGNTVTVNGHLYTAVAGTPSDFTEFSIDTDDTAAAASLAAAINAREAAYHNVVTAEAALGVVTVTATADGTSGNDVTLAKVGDPITVSGVKLTGGTATGGVESSGATDQLILIWYNKNG